MEITDTQLEERARELAEDAQTRDFNYSSIDATLDRLRDARESLKWLGLHHHNCEIVGSRPIGKSCTCGLSAFIDSRKKLLNSK